MRRARGARFCTIGSCDTNLPGGQSCGWCSTNPATCSTDSQCAPGAPCDDCLVLPTNGEGGRVLRDLSAFHLADIEVADVGNEYRDNYYEISFVDLAVGFRCVYSPKAD